MRKALALLVIGLTVLTLSGCALANSLSYDLGNDPGVPWGTPSGNSEDAVAPPTSRVDVCALLPVATVSALSGKNFGSAKTLNDPGSDCAYMSADAKDWFFWDVSINDIGSKVSAGLFCGADGGPIPLNGAAYPALASTDGVSLRWGVDVVIVCDESTYKVSRTDAAHYLAVAQALIAAIRRGTP